MKRYRTLVVTGAILASVFGLFAASAAPLGPCESEFRTHAYCGEHVGMNRLPLSFRVNVGSRPPNLSSLGVTTAVTDAIDEWNRHWPLPTGQLTCPALCLVGTSDKTGINLHDGENTISFSNNLGPCGGLDHDGLAVACVRTGPADRIVEVDIVLNSQRTWYQPLLVNGPATDPKNVAAGEVAGLWPELGNNDTFSGIGDGRGRYDVQSVVTHELGHALGLLDIGAEDQQWPGVTDDADRYQQTMYRWYYRGTTNKRTLHDGDIAGLLRVALDVVMDG